MEKIWTNLHINKSSNKKSKPVKVENYTQNSLYRSNNAAIYEWFMLFIQTLAETLKHLFYDCTITQTG